MRAMACGETQALPAPLAAATVRQFRRGGCAETVDQLAEETPVALVYNGVSHAVMMATPQDLEDLALGFSLSEGLLGAPHELYGIDVVTGAEGIAVEMEVAAAAFARLKERRRSMAGRTGCGLCGVDSLAQVRQPLPPLRAPRQPFRRAAITAALRAMQAAQPLQQAAGALHAAAWCAADGRVLALREDVGRHNAIDKLIGARARGGLPEDGFFCISSRASFEMVQKAAMAGAALLVAVSAPTARAVRTADAAGLTLVGFARGDDCVVYSHPGRIAETAPQDSESPQADPITP